MDAVATGTADSSSATGAEPPKGDRSRRGVRDMVLSMVVLLVALLGILWLTGAVSFDPGGPDVKPSSAPARNSHDELRSDSQRVPFALRDPLVPGGWRSNSADVVPIGAGATASVAVQVGWITPGDGYLRLSQSAGAVDDLVHEEAGIDGGSPAPASGTVEVAGTSWTIYPGRRQEKSWVTDLGGVRVLITGNGDDQQFRRLATAVRTAKVLPPVRGMPG